MTNEAVLYLLRQRLCARFGHDWRPDTAGTVELEDGFLADATGEECARCHAYRLLLFPRGDET